jgi:hypothetical protein
MTELLRFVITRNVLPAAPVAPKKLHRLVHECRLANLKTDPYGMTGAVTVSYAQRRVRRGKMLGMTDARPVQILREFWE